MRYDTNPFSAFKQVWSGNSNPLKFFSIIALIFALIGGAFTFLPIGDYFLEKFGQFSLVITAGIWLFIDASLKSIEKEKIEAKIERAEKAIEEHPDQARPLWDLAQSRLERYFDRNLSQVRSIFWITLLVMFAGFSMIGFGVFKALDGTNIDAALLSSCSGIITEFIATTFLVIYKSTLNQANGYVKTLERMNAVGMSIQMLDSISEKHSQLKTETRAKLTSEILNVFTEKNS